MSHRTKDTRRLALALALLVLSPVGHAKDGHVVMIETLFSARGALTRPAPRAEHGARQRLIMKDG